jgi:polar amino acid transport system substrate-binding protein
MDSSPEFSDNSLYLPFKRLGTPVQFCTKFLAFLLVAGCFFSASTCGNVSYAAQPEKFIFGTGTEAHMFTGMWERLIYIEAFKRLGVRLEFVVAPLKRIEMLLERGDIDGETIRGPVYGTLHPQLIAIDLPLIPVKYALYALKPVAGLNSLEDLRAGKFRGAYRRGVVFCENALTNALPANQLDVVTTAKQGMDMLAIKHIDFFCDVNLGMLNYEYEAGQENIGKPIKLLDISKAVSNSAYLHPRHIAFAPILSATLKQMEKEGLIEKYRLETMARLKRS